MKHYYLINSINAIVSDAEIKEGDWTFDTDNNSIRKEESVMGYVSGQLFEGYKKIEYSNNPLEGLKPFELVDELANESFPIGTWSAESVGIGLDMFKAGYKAKAGYNLEDMRKCFNAAKEGGIERVPVLIDQYGGVNIEEHFTANKYKTFDDYLQEQDSKLIEVIQISDSVFKIYMKC